MFRDLMTVTVQRFYWCKNESKILNKKTSSSFYDGISEKSLYVDIMTFYPI